MEKLARFCLPLSHSGGNNLVVAALMGLKLWTKFFGFSFTSQDFLGSLFYHSIELLNFLKLRYTIFRKLQLHTLTIRSTIYTISIPDIQHCALIPVTLIIYNTSTNSIISHNKEYNIHN